MISTKAVKPYTLLSKIKGISVDATDRILPETLSMKKASTVDVVEIGKTTNPEQKIRISTFRDINNNIIEKVHEYEGIEKPETHRLYRELPNHEDYTLKGRLVQIFENLDTTGRFKAWQKVASEKQYVKSSTAKGNTSVTIAKVTTDERTINPVKHEKHSLTEYYVPKAHGGQKIEPKHIEFETETTDGIPQITTISASKDVKIPENDEYLAMRVYDSDSVKIPITQTALKERGLENLDISVTNSYRMDELTNGAFYEDYGRIEFNTKYRDKHKVIETGYHEPEHAYQYYIMGITGKLDTRYGIRCKERFKGTITPQMEYEATLYEQGHKNYVQPEDNYQAYRDNILEQCGREAGSVGIRYYLQKGRELAEQFKGIPNREL